MEEDNLASYTPGSKAVLRPGSKDVCLKKLILLYFTRRSPLLGFEYGNNLLYRLLGDTVHLFPVTLSLSFVGNAVNTEKYVY